MGFQVDLAEMKEANNALQRSAQKLNEQAEDAKNANNSIITSNALQGQVGQAIAGTLNNQQNAILIALGEAYLALSEEVGMTIQAFMSSVGEGSDSAVLNEDALDNASSLLTSMQTEHETQQNKFKSIYSQVDDLISLDMPKNDFDESVAKTKKNLTDIRQKVSAFDYSNQEKQIEALIGQIGTKIQQMQSSGGLSYTDPAYLHFASDAAFAEAIETNYNTIKEEERQEKIKAKKVKEAWAKHHPVTNWLQETSGTVGGWWGDIVTATRNLPLPGQIGEEIKGDALTVEGFIGGAGKMVSSTAIGVSELVQLAYEAHDYTTNGLAMPEWEMKDLYGAGKTAEAIGSTLKTIGLGITAFSNPVLMEVSPSARKAAAETFEMGKSAAEKIVHDVASGDSYAIGGYIFDVASMFVGPGEVNAALKGTSMAEKLAEGAEILKVASKASLTAKTERIAEITSRAVKYGDNLVKGIAKTVDSIPLLTFMNNKVAMAGENISATTIERTTIGEVRKSLFSSADEIAEKASEAKEFNIDEIHPKLKTEPDTAFFWSGRTDGVGGADVAANVAKSKGGVTLESTIGNKNIKMPEWDFNKPESMKAWDLASGSYAEQVSGEVRAVVGSELRKGNIWENVELPRLKNNPKVTKITTIDPKTGIEKIIFERK